MWQPEITILGMQTGPRGQREWKFYESLKHEKQAAAAGSNNSSALRYLTICIAADGLCRPQKLNVALFQQGLQGS